MGKPNPLVAAYIAACRDRCVVCGEDDPAALDFHHVDPATKSFNVASVGRSKSLQAVDRELAKCVVLCASCHRKVHAGRIELEGVR